MRRSLPIALALLSLAAGGAAARQHGPARGALVVAGGGNLSGTGIFERFVELAGGPGASIVVIPTAGTDDACFLDLDVPDCAYDDSYSGLEPLRAAGATHLTVLHTRDRRIADSESFVRPIREATGVWLPGGRHWKLADAYLDTRTHRELMALLDRGGVIGGSSAGAHIQSDWMNVSRAPEAEFENRRLPRADWRRGFAFLRGVTIDVHVLARNRQFDMLGVIAANPGQLGVGLDEQAAIVVQGDRFEVIGSSYALIYDEHATIPPEGADTYRTVGGDFYFLRPGDVFDMTSREATRGGRPAAERVTKRGG